MPTVSVAIIYLPRFGAARTDGITAGVLDLGIKNPGSSPCSGMEISGEITSSHSKAQCGIIVTKLDQGDPNSNPHSITLGNVWPVSLRLPHCPVFIGGRVGNFFKRRDLCK